MQDFQRHLNVKQRAFFHSKLVMYSFIPNTLQYTTSHVKDNFTFSFNYTILLFQLHYFVVKNMEPFKVDEFHDLHNIYSSLNSFDVNSPPLLYLTTFIVYIYIFLFNKHFKFLKDSK